MSLDTYGQSVAFYLSKWAEDQTDNDDVRASYKTTYWDVISGDSLPKGLDLCVFDFALRTDVETAVSNLQTMIGATASGTMDDDTLTAVDTYVTDNGLTETIQLYQQRKVGDGSYAIRNEQVENLAIELIDYEPETPPDPTPTKAPEGDDSYLNDDE
jgi:lysozyme family protein